MPTMCRLQKSSLTISQPELSCEAFSRAGVIESILGELFSNKMSIELMEHAATLDLQQFEDAKFYDQMERARRGCTSGSAPGNCSA